MKNYVAVGSLAFIGSFAATNAIAQKPNLLVIHTDEHSFRTIGCYRELMQDREMAIWGNSREVETPHIDALAANGILFNSCYTTTPVSSPSRASFLSGLYPQNSDVTTNNLKLRTDAYTIANGLKDSGYNTYYVGKWHLDGDAKPGWSPEDSYGFDDNKYMLNRGHYKIMEEADGKVTVQAAASSEHAFTTENFTTDFLTDRSIDFIEGNKDKPFFLMLSLPDPHGPNTVRAPYDTMYSDVEFSYPISADIDKSTPSWNWGKNKLENMVTYFGMVKCIDDNVGRIMKMLEEQGILDNTIIVFTSDHGDLCGEHYRTNKGVPLEASSRIPFIVSYPKAICSDVVVEETISTVDFTPTMLSFMGVKHDAQYDGRDLSSILKKGKFPKNEEDVIFMRGTESWISAATQQYKLTLSRVDGEGIWFTDLKADPLEMENHIDNPKYKKVISNLAKQIINYAKEYNDSYAAEGSKVDKELQLLIKK